MYVCICLFVTALKAGLSSRELVCSFACLPFRMPVSLSVCLSPFPSVFLPFSQSVSQSALRFICVSSNFPLCRSSVSLSLNLYLSLTFYDLIHHFAHDP